MTFTELDLTSPLITVDEHITLLYHSSVLFLYQSVGGHGKDYKDKGKEKWCMRVTYEERLRQVKQMDGKCKAK